MESLILVIFLGVSFVPCTSGFVSLEEYFPEYAQDISRIRWVRKVSELTALENAIRDRAIHVIQFDVSCGWPTNYIHNTPLKPTPKPDKDCGFMNAWCAFSNVQTEHQISCSTRYDSQGVAAVPVIVGSSADRLGVTLETWLLHLRNTLQRYPETRKGIMLTMLSAEAAVDAAAVLNKQHSQFQIPLWVAADILDGPVRARIVQTPVSPQTFLRTFIKGFPPCTLAPGWTTSLKSWDKPTSRRYTWSHVMAMYKEITKAGFHSGEAVMFPVRASFIPYSIQPLQWLLEVTGERSSLMVSWDRNDDPIPESQLSLMKNSFGVRRLYLDIPVTAQDQFLSLPWTEPPKELPLPACGEPVHWTFDEPHCALNSSEAALFFEGECLANLNQQLIPAPGSQVIYTVEVEGIVHFYDASEDEPESHYLESVWDSNESQMTFSDPSSGIVWLQISSTGIILFKPDPSKPPVQHAVPKRSCVYFKLVDEMQQVSVSVESHSCIDQNFLNATAPVERKNHFHLRIPVSGSRPQYGLTLHAKGPYVKVLSDFKYSCSLVTRNSHRRAAAYKPNSSVPGVIIRPEAIIVALFCVLLRVFCF